MVKHKEKIIGTLVPIFSLRSNQLTQADQGTFAAAALFLDWLKKTQQTAWQILPISERQLEKGSCIKHVPSPYKGYGLGLSSQYLPQAYKHVQPSKEALQSFLDKEKEWIEEYALFCALRDHFKTDDWSVWDPVIRKREKNALKFWRKKLGEMIHHYIVEQWQLHQSYDALRTKAKTLGIKLIGDMPYYISLNSPLTWAYQEVFQLEKSVVSGISDTSGTHFGRQVWGHPLYNWSKREEVVAFWKMRLRYQARLFDILRFDHAKAFFVYGSIDPYDQNNDRYEEGPGEEVLRELVAFCKDIDLDVFAEDSGDRTQDLRKSLKTLHISGMRIFWFALMQHETSVSDKYAEISNYPLECVAYTTTHDTQTLLGYLESLNKTQKEALAHAAGLEFKGNDAKFAQSIRDMIIRSPSRMVIVPIQDWLLTTERINVPGTEKEINDLNWQYSISMPIEKLPIVKI